MVLRFKVPIIMKIGELEPQNSASCFECSWRRSRPPTLHRGMRLAADAKPETATDLRKWGFKQVCQIGAAEI